MTAVIVADINVRFNERTYITNEKDGQIQPVLVLSNQVSYIISVTVRSHDKNATG